MAVSLTCLFLRQLLGRRSVISTDRLIPFSLKLLIQRSTKRSKKILTGPQSRCHLRRLPNLVLGKLSSINLAFYKLKFAGTGLDGWLCHFTLASSIGVELTPLELKFPQISQCNLVCVKYVRLWSAGRPSGRDRLLR